MFLNFRDIDAGLLLWIQEYVRQDWLNPVFRFITFLGDKGMIWIIIILALLLMKDKRRLGLLSFVSISAVALINNIIIKHIFNRTRPFAVIEDLQTLVAHPHDSSFPSGHTAVSICVGVVLFRNLPKKYSWIFLVLSISIGLSRMYVGVHYPTDVLVGAMVGVATAFLSQWVFEMIENKSKDKTEKASEEDK